MSMQLNPSEISELIKERDLARAGARQISLRFVAAGGSKKKGKNSKNKRPPKTKREETPPKVKRKGAPKKRVKGPKK